MIIKAAKRIYSDLKALGLLNHWRELPFRTRILSGDEITGARMMLASIYRDRGIVDPSVINEHGVIDEKFDPYWRQSVYFGVYSDQGELLMTARLVRSTRSSSWDLPFHVEQLPIGYRDSLLAMDRQTIAEVGAYVRAHDISSVTSRILSMYLFRAMLQYSYSNGISTWVFGLRPELRASYSRLFGRHMRQIGEYIQLGQMQALFVPFLVDVNGSYTSLTHPVKGRIGGRSVADFMRSEAFDQANVKIPT